MNALNFECLLQQVTLVVSSEYLHFVVERHLQVENHQYVFVARYNYLDLVPIFVLHANLHLELLGCEFDYFAFFNSYSSQQSPLSKNKGDLEKKFI